MKKLITLLLTVLAAGALYGDDRAGGSEKQPSRVLTVFHFINTAGEEEYQWMSRAFADGLNSRLSSAGLTLVERQDLEEVLKQQKLSLSGLTDESTALELGHILNATDLIRGSYLVLDGRLRTEIKVTDSVTGQILFTASREADDDGYVTLEGALAAALGEFYSVETGEQGVSGSREALRLYYKGLLSLDRDAYDQAVADFQASLDLDPLFQAPRESLEESYRFLRDFRRARYQREMNTLYRRLANLLEMASQEPFQSWGDRVTALALAGEDVTALTERIEEEPELTWGSTRAEVLWHAQTVMMDIARYAVEYFEDEEEAERMREQTVAVSRSAVLEIPDDPFLPELIYQELLAWYYRGDWDAVQEICETLMMGWPDFRMMWAVEDFYERSLEEGA